MKNVKTLGQVFTPENVVISMLSLIKNSGRFLEPSSGEGAFFKHLPKDKIAIEIDKKLAKDNVINMDFFDFSEDEKFDTIIGNPPYVRYQDIEKSTKEKLQKYMQIFDERSNLYLFFIYKCILHLKNGGELIFITPRNFLKSTSSIKLNNFLFSNGTITHFWDLGDKKLFDNAQPNCAIWRYEKDNFTRKTNRKQKFSCINGQILFVKKHFKSHFNDLFFVKVGAVSGADKIFANKLGNTEFVCSYTAKTKNTKKMFYGEEIKNEPFLINKKNELLKRKIKNFNENNWWQWGRDYYKSDDLRIYVNAKTRNKKPFFMHSCKAYDGSILAIFPKFKATKKNLKRACELLNETNWDELGFVCDGRFLFSQRSLENSILNFDLKDLQ